MGSTMASIVTSYISFSTSHNLSDKQVNKAVMTELPEACTLGNVCMQAPWHKLQSRLHY